MDLKSTYDRIAKDWAKNPEADTWSAPGVDQYISLLGKNAQVLDVGCGSGAKSRYLAGKGLRVTGIDFSEEMIKLAKSQVPDGTFLVKDIREPLELGQAFDGVFAQAVLLHIPKADIANVLKNILLPLKPGGYLYVSVKGRQPGGKEEDISKDNKYGYEFERFFSYFIREELADYLVKLGLEVTHISSHVVGEKTWLQIIASK